MAARTPTDPNDFCLPDLGEGLEEAELIEWCVHVGQAVKENQTLAKMETAKALVEVPSPRDGIITVLHGQPGQSIKVGAPLVTYAAAAAAAPRPAPAKATPPPADRPDAGSVVGELGAAPVDGGKAQATPAVRRLARDLGVDIDHVTGTGIGGRVTAEDIQGASHASPPQAGAERSAAPAPAPTTPDATRIPFRGVRRTIAEHLRHSVNQAIHFTVMDEADVTALEAMRRKLIAASNEKITLLPFVASAVCRVLMGRQGQQFCRLNSTVDDERQEIVQHHTVHLGIAADTDNGLMVPVVRDAQHLGVLELGRKIHILAKAARDRSIVRELLSGSTFTISNFGSLAGRFGTPIINYPEAAILAVGRAREGVIVHNGMLGVGRLLPLSLAADHRVLDGSTAAAALAKIVELLQSPEDLLAPVA